MTVVAYRLATAGAGSHTTLRICSKQAVIETSYPYQLSGVRQPCHWSVQSRRGLLTAIHLTDYFQAEGKQQQFVP